MKKYRVFSELPMALKYHICTFLPYGTIFAIVNVSGYFTKLARTREFWQLKLSMEFPNHKDNVQLAPHEHYKILEMDRRDRELADIKVRYLQHKKQMPDDLGVICLPRNLMNCVYERNYWSFIMKEHSDEFLEQIEDLGDKPTLPEIEYLLKEYHLLGPNKMMSPLDIIRVANIDNTKGIYLFVANVSDVRYELMSSICSLADYMQGTWTMQPEDVAAYNIPNRELTYKLQIVSTTVVNIFG